MSWNYDVYTLRQHTSDIIITKPDKGNGVAILDQKLYDNVIREIISDNLKSSMKTLSLKLEASLTRFLLKLKQKSYFNKKEYNKLYPSGSARTRI